MEPTKVYVFMFRPFEDRACVGGFDWFYSPEKAMDCFHQDFNIMSETHQLKIIDFILEQDAPLNQDPLEYITSQIDLSWDDLWLDTKAIMHHTPAA